LRGKRKSDIAKLDPASSICKQTLITMAGGSLRLSLQCKAYYLKNGQRGRAIIMPFAA